MPGCARPVPYVRALNGREASCFRHAAVVWRASCGLQRAAGLVVARACAPLRWLSQENRHSTRVHARAQCCADCGGPTLFARAPRCREAALLQRALVMRRANCGHQCAAGLGVARTRAPLRWLSLGRRRSTRAFYARATCRAGCGLPMAHVRILHRREASSFDARPWCDVPAAATNAQLALAWHARERHCAGCLSGGSTARKSSGRVPCRAGCGRSVFPKKLLGRRQASQFRHVPAVQRARCGLKRAAGFGVARARAPLRWLSLGRVCSTRVFCALAPCRAGCVDPWLINGYRTGERSRSFGRRPWCDVPAAAINARPALA